MSLERFPQFQKFQVLGVLIKKKHPSIYRSMVILLFKKIITKLYAQNIPTKDGRKESGFI